jgi:starch synthase (maltosyl-transferring)
MGTGTGTGKGNGKGNAGNAVNHPDERGPSVRFGADPDRPDGRRRVVVDAIRPLIDGGAYAVKRVIGDRVRVEADLLADGHDKLAGRLWYRGPNDQSWREAPLSLLPPGPPPAGGDGDTWTGEFVVDALGTWRYTVSAWVDSLESWLWGIERKATAGQDLSLGLRDGAALVLAAADRAPAGPARETLRRLAASMTDSSAAAVGLPVLLPPEIRALMHAYPDRSAETVREPALELTVEPLRARFSNWYELFPRSHATDRPDESPAGHGTLREAEGRLPYIAQMGFDIVYLPPIHPIGRAYRKGPDNSLTAGPDDPGSPWAIGAAEGGHKSVHPQLGTLEDFHHFLRAAQDLGMQVALDIALQASPDHPYVREHPEWFVHRADGSIQYAENPPKKYQDIYPFDFSGPAWQAAWDELRSIFTFWIEQGVTVFRVDNPHTKPLPFWRWCIASIKKRHPEVIFLAEAFTRPKVMYALAKGGFSQSYTYFTWRTSKRELTEYVRSLAQPPVSDFFRPNFWPNTPDILPEHLQFGTRGTFIARAALAATLAPSWGVYGPVFELQEKAARPGAEEYAQNEKYQVRQWRLDSPDNLAPVLERLNRIRREHPALQRLEGTTFHRTDNESLLCYSRADERGADLLLVVVNLDGYNTQGGWIDLDPGVMPMGEGVRYQMHDLMSDARYVWTDARAYVSLDPRVMPAHVFHARRLVRSERTFEYYL